MLVDRRTLLYFLSIRQGEPVEERESCDGDHSISGTNGTLTEKIPLPHDAFTQSRRHDHFYQASGLPLFWNGLSCLPVPASFVHSYYDGYIMADN